jgi:hypothetical protein
MSHNEHREHSPSASVVNVETSRLVPWMLLAVLAAGVSLGLSVTTIYIQATAYRELERENRLLQLKVDEFRMALIAADIDPNPHAKGESK